MSLFLFSCIEQILQWILELLALLLLSFSQRPPACLPACLPTLLTLSLWLRYWWFLFVHCEQLFIIIKIHYIIVISSLPEPSRSSILAFQKPWYHSLWSPCGFRLFKLLHPFVDCEVFFYLCTPSLLLLFLELILFVITVRRALSILLWCTTKSFHDDHILILNAIVCIFAAGSITWLINLCCVVSPGS